MEMLSKIAALFLVNTLGFFSVVFCYYIGLADGIISASDPDFDAAAFKSWFLTGTIMTWLACAVFSLSFLFLQGKMRLVFLWAPVIVPVLYGLSVLYGPLSSL